MHTEEINIKLHKENPNGKPNLEDQNIDWVGAKIYII
jgi:hypothetical protein